MQECSWKELGGVCAAAVAECDAAALEVARNSSHSASVGARYFCWAGAAVGGGNPRWPRMASSG